MTGPKAFGLFLNISLVISIVFAVPIVMPVVALLGWLLVMFSGLLAVGIVLQLHESYK